MIGILGTGLSIPPQTRSTSKDFSPVSKHHNTTKHYIERLTGVRKRRQASTETTAQDLAAAASINAIHDAGLSPHDIGIALYCSVYGPAEPAGAMFVAEAIGLRRSAQADDVKSACHGFASAIRHGTNAILSGDVRYVLICSGELGTRMAEHSVSEAIKSPRDKLKNHAAAFTLGDLGSAWVLSAADEAPFVIVDTEAANDFSLVKTCVAETTNSPFVVDAAALQAKVLPQVLDGVGALLDRHLITQDQIDALIVHQTSSSVLNAWEKALPESAHKLLRTVNDYGNVISGSLALGLHHKKGDVEIGKYVLACIQGSGAVFSSFLIQRTKEDRCS